MRSNLLSPVFMLQVFHCVHFECPASASALAEYTSTGNKTSTASSSSSSSPAPPAPTPSSPPPSPRGGELQGLDDLESRGDGLVLEPQQMVVVEGAEDEEEAEGAAAGAAAGAAPALGS